MPRLPHVLLACFMVALPAHATTSITNYTDLWWNPAEPGWGVTVTQERTTLFVTLFVYGRDNLPTWLTGTLELSGDAAALPTFTGDLNATTGPWYGLPAFPPGQVGLRTVGRATFAPTSLNTARLEYIVDGTMVAKIVQRQTLRNENLSGRYAAKGRLTLACPGLPSMTAVADQTLVIVHAGASFEWHELDETSPGDECVATGTATQDGQFTRASGNFQCTDSNTPGTLRLSEITSTPIGFTGRYDATMQESGVTCTLSGAFTALRIPSTTAGRADPAP